MAKAHFLSAATLKKLPTFIHGNIEETQLRAVIDRAQDTVIRPLLGKTLNTRLELGVKDNNLTDDEKLLVTEYIIPALTVVCEIRAALHTTIEIRAKAAGKSSDEYMRAAEAKDLKNLQDQLQNDLEVYKTDLVCYLTENYEKYPQYYATGEPGCGLCAGRPESAAPKRSVMF